jgi:hypothetical protein
MVETVNESTPPIKLTIAAFAMAVSSGQRIT